MGFDVSKWNKQRYLAEAGIIQEVEIDTLHDLLYNADPSYSNLAKAIAKFLKGTEEDLNSGFSKDQIKDFMKILHAELGMKESLSENKDKEKTEFDINFFKEFNKEFNSSASDDEDLLQIKASNDRDSLKIKSDMDLSKETFEKMIKFVEKKGYNVDLNKSVNWYDREEDKTVYPTIKLSKK